MRTLARLATCMGALSITLSGCGEQQAVSSTVADQALAAQPSMTPTAAIQDIMKYMVDPSADFLWESVSTVATTQGVEEHQPRTDEEWEEVRKHAILLTEAANLLTVRGRHIARAGQRLDGEGEPGNLTLAEMERAVTADFPAFASFASALHEVGAGMLAAANAQDAEQLLVAGDQLDEVCESCHLRFWYPEEPQAK